MIPGMFFVQRPITSQQYISGLTLICPPARVLMRSCFSTYTELCIRSSLNRAPSLCTPSSQHIGSTTTHRAVASGIRCHGSGSTSTANSSSTSTASSSTSNTSASTSTCRSTGGGRSPGRRGFGIGLQGEAAPTFASSFVKNET